VPLGLFSVPSFAMFTTSFDVLLCPLLALVSLLKFVLTLISLAWREDIGAADVVVILESADCGIDCGGLLVTALTYDRVRLAVGESWGCAETAAKILAANASRSSLVGASRCMPLCTPHGVFAM